MRLALFTLALILFVSCKKERATLTCNYSNSYIPVLTEAGTDSGDSLLNDVYSYYYPSGLGNCQYSSTSWDSAVFTSGSISKLHTQNLDEDELSHLHHLDRFELYVKHPELEPLLIARVEGPFTDSIHYFEPSFTENLLPYLQQDNAPRYNFKYWIKDQVDSTTVFFLNVNYKVWDF